MISGVCLFYVPVSWGTHMKFGRLIWLLSLYQPTLGSLSICFHCVALSILPQEYLSHYPFFWEEIMLTTETFVLKL